MSACDQEMCPMWDGSGCPCATFRLDRDDLPTDGTFSVDGPPSCDESNCYCENPHRCGWHR